MRFAAIKHTSTHGLNPFSCSRAVSPPSLLHWTWQRFNEMFFFSSFRSKWSRMMWASFAVDFFLLFHVEYEWPRRWWGKYLLSQPSKGWNWINIEVGFRLPFNYNILFTDLFSSSVPELKRSSNLKLSSDETMKKETIVTWQHRISIK